MSINIIVNLQFQALHKWSNCDITEVQFLKHEHRHLFHIKCKKEVSHDDRDIEIIMLKNSIYNFLLKKYYDAKCGFGNFGEMSCEMIANELVSRFNLIYCSVLEDGENGAEVII